MDRNDWKAAAFIWILLSLGMTLILYQGDGEEGTLLFGYIFLYYLIGLILPPLVFGGIFTLFNKRILGVKIGVILSLVGFMVLTFRNLYLNAIT